MLKAVRGGNEDTFFFFFFQSANVNIPGFLAEASPPGTSLAGQADPPHMRVSLAGGCLPWQWQGLQPWADHFEQTQTRLKARGLRIRLVS